MAKDAANPKDFQISDAAYMDDYWELLGDRPRKFDQHAANYHRATNQYRCDQCTHFFEREIDSYKVCEVVRPVEKGEEQKILPEFTCQFFTRDGKQFPLYKGGKE